MLYKLQRIFWIITILSVFLILITGLFLRNDKIDYVFHGSILKQPKTIVNFSLQGIDKKIYNNASFYGRWTMLFFGFTNCTSVCPVTMAELAKMYQILKAKNISVLPKIVLVSIDPLRDELSKLSRYVKSFNQDFYGVSGSSQIINDMAQDMGIVYKKINLNEEKNIINYDIQHSGAILLFNPSGKLVALFTLPHHAMQLANDYQWLILNSNSLFGNSFYENSNLSH